MTEAEFADWALKITLPGLVIWMGLIVWKLSRESRAGRLGTFVLFLVLGLGVSGFLFKEVILNFVR
jgi:hypothetical protein